MQFPFIIIIKSLHVRGIALFPFIIYREKKFAQDAVIMNHELIHHRQQIELLIIPFYIIYLLNYLINRFRYKNHHDAYTNIIFEREAYSNDADLDYLKRRKWFSFLKYL